MMPNISLTAPTDYSAELEAIARKRKLAELMQQQAMEPIGQTQAVGGWAIPQSPMQGIGKIAQALSGSYQQQQATEQQKALAQKYQTEGQAALAKGLRQWQGTPASTEIMPMDEQANNGEGQANVPINLPAVAGDQASAMATLGSHPMTSPYAAVLAKELFTPPKFGHAPPGSVSQNLKTGEFGTQPVQMQPKYQMVPGADPTTGAPVLNPIDMNKPPIAPIPQAVQNQYLNTGGEQTPVPRYSPPGTQPTAIPKTVDPSTQFRVENRIMPDTAAYSNVQPDGQGGYIGLSKKTGTMEKIPQAPGVTGAGQLTGDALDLAAQNYKLTRTLPTNLGRGQQGAANTVKVISRAAELAKQEGNTTEEAALNQIANRASVGALSQLQKQETMVSAFERTFNKNADLAVQWSSKVDRTGVPIANKWIQAGKRAVTGDPDLVAYDAIIKGVANEYTKIISGSMGNMQMAEQEIKRVESLLTAAQTPQQVTQVIDMMKRETQNRMAGFKEQRDQLMGSVRGRRATDSSAPARTYDPATGTFR